MPSKISRYQFTAQFNQINSTNNSYTRGASQQVLACVADVGQAQSQALGALTYRQYSYMKVQLLSTVSRPETNSALFPKALLLTTLILTGSIRLSCLP